MRELLILRKQPEIGFKDRLTVDNMQRSKLTLLIVIAFELLMLGHYVYKHSFSFNIYIYFYVSLIVVSIIALAILLIGRRKNISLQVIDACMFSYYMFFLLWGGALTILDQFTYGQVTAYLSNVLVGILMYHTSMRRFILLQIAPFFFVILGISFIQKNTAVLEGHLINVTIFIVFASIGSRFLYNYAVNSYDQQSLLRRSNEKLNRLNNELQKISARDELTGLYNRRGLYRYIESHSSTTGTLSAILVDVDAFKQFNDFYGHLEGDFALKAIAGVLEDLTEQEHLFAARYGGEEFIILLMNYTQQQSSKIAHQLCETIRALEIPHEKSPYAANLSVSVGVSAVHNSSVLMEHLFKEADEALYEAKERGRNQVVTYTRTQQPKPVPLLDDVSL